MKVYSIGREMGCDIVINDSTDVISRRHAILNVTSSGKMTIVDQSHNGTYVNGIRIAQNVPVPVTRKDNISFAHVARLDWNMVPKSTSPWLYVIIGIVVVALIAGGIFAYLHFAAKPDTPAVTNDSTKTTTNAGQEQTNDSNKTATPAPTKPTAPKANSGKKNGSAKASGKGNDTNTSGSEAQGGEKVQGKGNKKAGGKDQSKPGGDEKSKTGGRGMR